MTTQPVTVARNVAVQPPGTTVTDPRPAPPVGSARCTIGGITQSHKWACVFWLNLTAVTPAQADLQTLCAKVSSSYGTSITPVLPTNTIMNLVTLVWTPTAGQELIATDATSRPGTGGAGEIANSSSAFVINHRTGSYYRGGHSRSYLPGVATVDVTNGSTINSAKATAVANAWTAFVTAIKTGPAGGITAVDVGTVRFASKGDWLTPPQFVSWQSHSVRLTLGTQRGRLTE